MRAASSTSSSDRRALWVVRIAGLIAAGLFLSMRVPVLSGFLATGRDADGGDLYQMIRVRGFREPMPPETTTPPDLGVSAESAQVLFIGDSHGRFARGGASLSAMLAARIPNFRSTSATVSHPRFFDPSDELRRHRVVPGQVEVVFVESAERALADIAVHKIPQPFHAWDTTWVFEAVQWARDMNVRLFTGSEAGYQFLLFNSFATRRIVELWSTVRFAITGDLPGSIGAWRMDPPNLFLADEVRAVPPPPGETPTSFLQVRDSALVEAIASSFVEAQERLRRDYGARLVVVAVPAKSSILHGELGHAYDDFLPRVHRALMRRGIRSIDSWNALAPLGQRAVLRTETHLSAESYRVLADSLVAALRAP